MICLAARRYPFCSAAEPVLGDVVPSGGNSVRSQALAASAVHVGEGNSLRRSARQAFVGVMPVRHWRPVKQYLAHWNSGIYGLNRVRRVAILHKESAAEPSKAVCGPDLAENSLEWPQDALGGLASGSSADAPVSRRLDFLHKGGEGTPCR